ncbi:MAG: D-tyrosyl-tRNA(Tyr) deacylase [Burkholderiales bacterium]|nr:D-tyrosyl-tRNA(Tyr) deacylase [Burkholderiales bacterium]
MIGLLQRVSRARVTVEGATLGAIERGIVVLAAVEPADGEPQAQRLAQRLLGYRVFADAAGKMNLSVCDIGGAVLLVPQFTLAADTTRGMRASFSGAAAPEQGRLLFDALVQAMRARYGRIETGRFGADMQVALVNDGPVTFWLRA